MSKKTVFDLQQEGAPKDLVVILESKYGVQYEASRAIANAKFNYYPSGIAYCKSVDHVKLCIDFCRDNEIEFRIRSGGHQHEGMCSGNNVLIIDLSEMHKIEYICDTDEAWIPVGKKLTNVYSELEAKNYIIPGGGCASVNVGGLTQGGGWGASIRKLGFTCDNILEAEVVLADGRIVYPSPTNHQHLFWALKGGGGGNFGIVTRFRFKLTKLDGPMTFFSLIWNKESDAVKAITQWMAMQRDLEHDRNLSTYCRMSVGQYCEKKDQEGTKNTLLSTMGGTYYGEEKELVELLNKYFKDVKFDCEEDERTSFKITRVKRFPKYQLTGNARGIDEKPLGSGDESLEKADHGSYVEEEIGDLSIAEALNYIEQLLIPFRSFFENLETSQHTSECPARKEKLPKAPAITCDGPHPHKVTSTFPKDVKCKEEAKKLDQDIAETIYNYLSQTCYYPDVEHYMSFHCMGGAVTDNPDERAFPYYNKPYMLQAQCWWNLADNATVNAKRKNEFNQWIVDFREALHGYIEGSFINFVDKDICGPYEPSKRQEILTQYYTEKNLKRLINVKNECDPNNLFNFKLSIPLKYEEG